jgi:CheY-like chemotaxis protein
MKAFEHLQDLEESGQSFPDLILLDLNMPIWSGWDFLDAIETLSFDGVMTIYILTSSENEEDFQRAEKYGLGDQYIIKPITKDNVKTIIEEMRN